MQWIPTEIVNFSHKVTFIIDLIYKNAHRIYSGDNSETVCGELLTLFCNDKMKIVRSENENDYEGFQNF